MSIPGLDQWIQGEEESEEHITSCAWCNETLADCDEKGECPLSFEQREKARKEARSLLGDDLKDLWG